MDTSKVATKLLAKTYADQEDPNEWFEGFYARVEGDTLKTYREDLKTYLPNRVLIQVEEGEKAKKLAQIIPIVTGNS